MTFTFPAAVAWDPVGKQAVKNSSFQAYAMADTGFVTPLTIKDGLGNLLAGNILNSGTQGVFPEFQNDTNATVRITDSTRSYVWTVNAVMQDESVAALVGDSASASAAAVRTAVGVAIADPASDISGQLSATYVPKWKPNTAYLAGDAVLSPSGDTVTAKANFTSGSTYSAANWNLSPTYASQSYVTPRRIPRPQPKKTVSAQSGHGFTIAGTYDAATNLNDTTDFVFGSQSIKVVTDATNASADIVKTGLSLDARAASLRVWLKVADMSKIGQIIFYAGSGGSLAANWLWTIAGTIPSPDTRIIQSGEWVGVTLPWSDATVTGTPDRSAITNLQIRFRGVVGQQATARVGGVEVVAADQSFSKGVVSITFDDSKDSQYNVARPILDKYGFPATAFTIPEAWGTATYMTLAQHKELEDKHGWEIAAHSMSVADHNTNFVGADPAYLDARLAAMRAFLKANGFRGSDVGAYPQGAFSPSVIDIVKKYQTAARLAVSTLDFRAETLPPADPMRIRSLQLNNGVTPAAVIAMIDKAIANKEWIVLLVHGVAAVGDAGNYPTSDFTTVVDYIASSGIACRTMGDVLAAATSPTVPPVLPAGEVNLAVGLSDVTATIVDSRFGYTLPETGADTGVYYQSVTLPLDAFTGTAIGFDVNWTSPVATTGTVRWLARLSVLGPTGAVVSTATTDVAITPTVPGTANTTATSRIDFPTIKADGTAKRLELRLTRTATHGGDTSTGDVRLLGAKLVYSKA